MSEPTYRIELTHNPADGSFVCWTALVRLIADDEYPIFTGYGPTREDAFATAQAWCKAKATEPLAPSQVLLTEDGDIHDPHDTTRACPRCKGQGKLRDPLYREPIDCGTCGGTGAVAA